MDLTQLSQMVSWLDEEHRHDREELAKLDQRLQSLGVENQQQARRIQELEGRLASTAAQLTRFTQLEQALQQLKNEMVMMLDKQTESRMQAEREGRARRGCRIGRHAARHFRGAQGDHADQPFRRGTEPRGRRKISG